MATKKMDFICCKCQDQDKKTLAEHFCENCTDYLCEKCVELHNGYFTKHVVLGRRDLRCWTPRGRKEGVDECEKHPGEVIKLHCDDHGNICCQICVSVHHRSCKNVSHLPDVARGIHTRREFQRLQSTINELSNRLNQLKLARKKTRNSLSNSCRKIVAEIKDLRKTISEALDKLEQETITEVEAVKIRMDKSIQDDIDHCVVLHAEMKLLLNDIESEDSQNEALSYISFKKCQDKIALMNNITNKPALDIAFKPYTNLLESIKSLRFLGEIQETCHNNTASGPDEAIKVSKRKTYYVGAEDDKETCRISGICELNDGRVVTLDSQNCKVKLLNGNHEVEDQYEIPSLPFDMCHTLENEVAVAVDSDEDKRHEIHFIGEKGGKLVKTRTTLTLNNNCVSLCYSQGQLYVGSGTALYVYTLDGKLLQKIYEDCSSHDTVSKCAVSLDGARIYILDFYKYKLVTLDKDGHVLSVLEESDLECPSALCVNDKNGCLYLCSRFADRVFQVDREGRKIVATIARKADGIAGPMAVYYSKNLASLFLGLGGLYGNNNILALKLA